MDDQLKQRLVGAAILVVLAAIFVPMLFDTPQPTSSAPEKPAASSFPSSVAPSSGNASDDPTHEPAPATTAAPAEPEPEVPTQTAAPVPEPADAETVATKQSPPGSSNADAPASQAESSTQAQSEQSKPEPRAEATDPSADGDGEWVVQVASFNELDNAANLVRRMRDKGFQAFTRKARVGSRDVVRVYAGPVAEKTAAERLGRDIESAFGESGLIVRNPVN